MLAGSFELQVLVNERPIREYGHQGRTYVAAAKGSRFTLKFRNNTAHRVLAVPSLDGLSVVDGQPAVGTSKGYIIPAYSSTEIKGWRTNLKEAADFVFTEKPTSYAGQTAGAHNCGVVAVKVWAEKFVPPPPAPVTIIHETRPIIVHEYPWHPWPYWRPWPDHIYTCSTGNITSSVSNSSGDMMRSLSMDQPKGAFSGGPTYACNASAGNATAGNLCHAGAEPQAINMMSCVNAADATPDFNLGAGYGQVREDVVSEAFFDRGTELATIEIFYSDEAALLAVGVPLSKVAQVSKPVPSSFGGFCRPPGVSV